MAVQRVLHSAVSNTGNGKALDHGFIFESDGAGSFLDVAPVELERGRNGTVRNLCTAIFSPFQYFILGGGSKVLLRQGNARGYMEL